MVTGLHSVRQNRLLFALSQRELQRLLPDLELVAMPVGEVLYEAGERPAYAYFPTTSLVSLLNMSEDGTSAEIALAGNDGMVGIALFMGGESMSTSAVVISAGYGYRLKARSLKNEFDETAGTRRLLLRYTQALITQTAQTAVCNRRHTVEQQLCRFLLLGLDRVFSNRLVMTHQLIANMLGVRREGITEAAGQLKEANVIQLSRGQITVLDRLGLEERVCECYTVVKGECERLLTVPVERGQRSPGYRRVMPGVASAVAP